MAAFMVAGPVFAQIGLCCLGMTDPSSQSCHNMPAVEEMAMPCHQSAPQPSNTSDCEGDCVLSPGVSAQPQFSKALLIEKAQFDLIDQYTTQLLQALVPQHTSKATFLLAKQAQSPPGKTYLLHRKLRL